jgi:hypothetical protein
MADMSVRIRKLALMLLILVLPWQSLAAFELPTAVHDRHAAVLGLTKVSGDAVSAEHVHRHHAADQDHDNDGRVTVQNDDTDSSDTAHTACTDVCCSPALAAPAALSPSDLANHGWAIAFAAPPLASRPLDCLEHPPRSSLV